jgi:hypothetical protein
MQTEVLSLMRTHGCFQGLGEDALAEIAEHIEVMRYKPNECAHQPNTRLTGRALPEVAGQEADYCKPEGRFYNQRMVSETSIIAISDPNDLLSFGIPPGFREKYIDSRLCPDVTNISINVAPIIDALGISAARPGPAHLDYDKDDRVIALLARGIGTPNTAPLIRERCEYTPTIE